MKLGDLLHVNIVQNHLGIRQNSKNHINRHVKDYPAKCGVGSITFQNQETTTKPETQNNANNNSEQIVPKIYPTTETTRSTSSLTVEGSRKANTDDPEDTATEQETMTKGSHKKKLPNFEHCPNMGGAVPQPNFLSKKGMDMF